MKQKHLVCILFLSLCCVSCASSPDFSDWYEPWADITNFPDVEPLKESQEPKIITSNSIEEDFFDVLSNRYWCIGETKTNGPDKDIHNDIITQCHQNGAIIALFSKTYTDTRSGVIGYGNYIGTYDVERFDYNVFYFIPLPKEFNYKLIFGIDEWNLSTSQLRQKTGRNTGVYVNVVNRDTPAFFANILRGDVIIRLDEYDVINTSGFFRHCCLQIIKKKLR